MRRNYYRGVGEWEEGRLRPRQDEPHYAEWSARSQFEQVCWLWRETYAHIEALRSEIGEDRVCVVRFEDLVAGPETTEKLFDFIGLNGFDEQQARQILNLKMNSQRGGDFAHPSQWSDEMHQVCWREVGQIAEIYGYPEVYPKRRAVGAA